MATLTASRELPVHQWLVRAVGRTLVLALIALPMLFGGKAFACTGQGRSVADLMAQISATATPASDRAPDDEGARRVGLPAIGSSDAVPAGLRAHGFAPGGDPAPTPGPASEQRPLHIAGLVLSERRERLDPVPPVAGAPNGASPPAGP